jgi:ABC-type Fe3+-hydroxamate transport system substrate-binding protein
MSALVSDPLQIFDEYPPRQVVSLVPSWTASLIDLGLAGVLVGATEYCPPMNNKIRILGGPKTIQPGDLEELKPDLVIASQEENDREAILAIAAAGIPVWLTFPKTVNEMIADLWTACSLFRSEQAMERVRLLEKNAEWLGWANLDRPPLRYFCPIWQGQFESGERWWMTFNDQTYSADVLHLMGGQNCFAQRERRYPIEAELGLKDSEPPGIRDTRYPRVSVSEIIDAQPEIILLGDEPFAYQEDDLRNIYSIFSETPACIHQRVHPVRGNLIHWPGTILAESMNELPDLFLAP